MKTQIKDNINNPQILENLYRSDKRGFEKAFLELDTEIKETEISGFWKARLEYGKNKEEAVLISKKDLLYMGITCIIGGLLIKLPQIFGFNMNENFFQERNVGLIVFFLLTLYSLLTKAAISKKEIWTSLIFFAISAVYVNILPLEKNSHILNLIYIHLPLMLWCFYGIVFSNFDLKNKQRRLEYIKYNGDLAILGGLILIAGGVLTALTMGLFAAIDMDIEKFYMENIAFWGLVSAPVVATFLIRKFPSITNKIAPVITTLFSPFVLLTLIIYLISILITGKDPYNDREFLLVFNIMLIGVMGIIVFTASELASHKKQQFVEITLMILSFVTIIIDIIALSAIVYRLGEYGFTPNRTAVLISNLLIFVNMVMIMIDLYKVNFKKGEVSKVEMTISNYLPVYALWTVIVVFIFPLIFGYR